MLKDLSEIRRLRKSAGLTQNELAKKVGVSQSLIAKIESGKTMPSYDIGLEIMDVLESMIEGDEKKNSAKDVHTSPFYHLSPEDPVGEALDLMRENAVSQLPVIENDRVVGSVTERRLVKIIDRLNRDDRISSMMGSSFPVLDENSELEMVKGLLNYYPCVVTSNERGLVGIITKADLLKKL